MKVLIVEDDEFVQKAIHRLLSHAGHDVLTAAHGQEALEILDTVEVDVILSDAQMPVMDGATFYKSLTPKLQDRVGFLTASPEEVRDLNVPYITKPAGGEAIKSLIRTVAARNGVLKGDLS